MVAVTHSFQSLEVMAKVGDFVLCGESKREVMSHKKRVSKAR